ncbi:tRNA (guanosine(37)-N1)-methyltransferase TrmD [Zwartia vadi]|uniref:tRNA (guanosine(37)-N1)-methyltransferase TrmD n=1 Tax=Zwartia vadi TaxID=3058168 RepID=UPI0025B441DF|nr:tRNA (guanosine(37)-N1)-methyltransferase TrmD [Zwartia vadi]MDN3988417.1 tRNA (guanosine(37)-N1)-methyltransferase TrmD [Zwartia vadi]
MRIDVITLFPDMFGVVRDAGVTGRAHQQGIWKLNAWNPRDFTHDIHRTVDDRPYGGGPGMVMLAEPLKQTLLAIQEDRDSGPTPPTESSVTANKPPVILLSPVGLRFSQTEAARLADSQGAIFVCGRYEGIDQRFIDDCVDEQWSLGDFVLSGGEIAALAMIDAAVRLMPGVLNHGDSSLQDSFQASMSGLLDSPHYTRPEVLWGQSVPAVLMSGNHAHIARWRREQSLALTAKNRPDLLAMARKNGLLTTLDEKFLASLNLTQPHA